MVSPNKKPKLDDEQKVQKVITEDASTKATSEKVGSVTQQLLTNPAVLSALQDKFNTIAGSSSGYIESLPEQVKKRMNALKNLQIEATNIEAKFYEEFHQLKRKYHELYLPLYEKRAKIISGAYEPTEKESALPESLKESKVDDSDHENSDKELKGENHESNPTKVIKNNETIKGIPSFWLTIFKNVEILRDMVHKDDEPVLEKLSDVKITYNGSESPMGCKLHFYFDPNEYFTNDVLTKEYEMKCIPSETNPYAFDGPEIVKCKGCKIDWKEGKRLPVKNDAKETDSKTNEDTKDSSKTSEDIIGDDLAASFFDFFTPPEIPNNDETNDIDEEIQEILETDFEVENLLREHIIPKAILYFTGEALKDGELEGDEDEEMEEEESEGENDPDYDPSKDKDSKTAPDCKQQ